MITKFNIKTKSGKSFEYTADLLEFQKLQDWYSWGVFDKYRYWEKYPESKPIFESTKVIIDEADKR